jgi:hypothetical protein
MGQNREDLEARLDRAKTKIKPEHCADCGSLNAHVPMACVLNMHTHVLDTHRLQLPPLCNGCAEDRGISRRGVLVPKTEMQNATEALTALVKKIPAWSKTLLAKQLKELVEQGMPEQEAKDFLGVE